jgi:diguanylate cyclase (GGDEF)-like protein/PAS domain S-box-containing protein
VNLSYATWLTVSGAITLLVAWWSWRRRAAPGARTLLMLMLTLAVWSLTYAVFWLSFTPEARAFWLNMTFFGVATAPVAFFVLVQYLIGREGWLTRRAYLLLLLIPALTLLFIWTDPWHGLFFGGNRSVDASVVFRGGPWFYVFLFYSYGLLGSGVMLLIRAYTRTSSLYNRQTRIVLIGAMFPCVVNILMLLGWHPLPRLDLTPLLFIVTSLLLAYGFFGYRMMDLVPFGRDALVENMEDAIVVVDTQGLIVDINPKAMGFADPGLELPFGKRLNDVFSRLTDIIPAFATFEGRVEIKLKRPPFSHVDLRIIPLKDREGRQVGKVIAWRDITARIQAEEQLRIFFRAVEQNPVAVVITDPEGSIEYVNPRFTQLTGYVLDEVRGRNPRILKSGETPDDLYDTLWQTIKSGQVWEGEILNRKKNGELYWAHAMIAPVLDEAGKATRFIAMQQDITASKHTEAELRMVNARLQVQLTEIERLHDQLREEAIRDGLTRLFNRRYMEETLDREISRAEREPMTMISVVMMDVDRFKTINDTFGHQAGDAVLQTLGTMLLENTRISDIACRYGGDEMLVVMPGASPEVAVARAEEWRVAFSMMEFTFGEEHIRTTLSLGVASFPEQAHNPIELLNSADKALYWAKTIRNQVCRFDPVTMAQGNNRFSDIR